MMSKVRIIFLICILVILDQSIKLYINMFHLNNNFNIIGEYVQFKPHLNTDYSWINSLFNLGLGRTFHIVIIVIGLIFIYILFVYISDKTKQARFVVISFIFIFSGVICSLIDKVYWNGSLDYILLKGLFIFDLKDVYITIFQISMIGLILTNYKGLRKTNV